MKKNVCSPLTLLLCLSLLPSCSEEIADGTDTSPISDAVSETVSETSYIEAHGKKDFKGEAFRIYVAPEKLPQSMLWATELDGNNVNDALFNRDASVKAAYNVDIVYDEDTRANALPKIKQSVLAGDKGWELILSQILGPGYTALVESDCLLNLCDLPYISFESDWWSKFMYKSMLLGDKLFYTTGDIAPLVTVGAFCTYVNLELTDSYNINGNFYQDVYDGKWTFDVISKCSRDLTHDLNGDGVIEIEKDFFGYTCEEGRTTTNALAIGGGIDISSIADGELKVGLNNEKTLKVIEKIRSFKSKDKVTSNANIPLAFRDGRVVFYTHLISTAATTLRDTEAPFAILPMPKYDEKQESYRSLINPWNNCYTAVQSTSTDLEKIGFLMEVMAYTSYRDVRPELYEVTLKEKALRDEDSKNMLDIIYNTIYLDFNCVYNFGGSADVLNYAILGTQPFASSYAAIEEKIAAAVKTVAELYL